MDDPNNVVSVYLIDSVKTSKGKKKVGVENIEVEEFAEKLDDKVCLSMQERENLFEIIKKNVENFKKLTKKSKSKTIKNLNEKLSQYITSKNNDKCIPIDLENINSIKYFNNFSKNTIIVPNRDSAVFYIENKEDQKGLLFIEFYLTEENKDIIFRLNKYDPKTDEFEMIHDTGKLGKKLKLALYFEGKTLYQIEFDNKYSWINKKEINYTFSVFKVCNKDILNTIEKKENEEVPIESNKEEKIENNNEIKVDINNEEEKNNTENKNEDIINEENQEKKEEKEDKKEIKEFKVSKAILNNRKTIKFSCINEGQKFVFNCNKIYKKIKEFQESEKNNLNPNTDFKLSILVYLNQLRFITFDKNEKIIYTELIDEKENIMTKDFFNKTLLDYLTENYKIENNNNKVAINLFCQNKNLALISNKIKGLINALKDSSINNMSLIQNKVCEQFLQKLGFNPDKKVGEYEVTYNLYDFSDQCLLYHLFLINCQEKYDENSTLVLIFDKNSLHVTAMNEGGLFTKFKSLENNWNEKYYSKLKMDDLNSIVDFIGATSESFEGLDLVLCYMNNEDKKDELLELFKKIQENFDEEIKIHIYPEDDLIKKVFKYIDCFIL